MIHKTKIDSIAKEHGFIVQNGVYFRIVNDVVQGFQRHKGIHFATYPIYDPWSNLYKFSFERRPISFLSPENSRQMVKSSVDQLKYNLLPYFQKYNSCVKCLADLPELAGNKNCMENVYFSLAGGEISTAISILESMIKQRISAYERNLQVFSAEQLQPQDRRKREKNQRDQDLIQFLRSSSVKEIEAYLQQNKAQAEFHLGYSQFA